MRDKRLHGTASDDVHQRHVVDVSQLDDSPVASATSSLVGPISKTNLHFFVVSKVSGVSNIERGAFSPWLENVVAKELVIGIEAAMKEQTNRRT